MGRGRKGVLMTEQAEAFLRFVGVDWGSEAHQVCVIDGSRKILLEKAFAHSGKGISELVEAVLAAGGVDSEQVLPRKLADVRSRRQVDEHHCWWSYPRAA